MSAIGNNELEQQNEKLRAALDGLLAYVSTMEEAKQWDSLSTPGAVVTAVAALVAART
jgi:hypothetical protein